MKTAEKAKDKLIVRLMAATVMGTLSIDDIDIRGRDKEGNLIINTED